MNIVIIDLTCTKLVQRALMMTMHVVIVVVHKARSYTEQMIKDDFIPLALETYDCFHPCFDSFSISCVHASITCH